MQVKSKKNLEGSNAPLHCWDIYIYGFQRRLELSGDLQRLQSLRRQYNWFEAPGADFALIWMNKVIVITDTTLQIIHATENIYSLTGYKSHEFIGKTAFASQGKDEIPGQRNVVYTSLNNHEPFDAILTNHKKNGEPYQYRACGYPIFNRDGVFVNYMAIESKV